MQHIFPTTAVSLGPGYVVGRERAVSKVAGTFGPHGWGARPRLIASSPRTAPRPGVPPSPATGVQVTLWLFDAQGWLLSRSVVDGAEAAVVVPDARTGAVFAVVAAGE